MFPPHLDYLKGPDITWFNPCYGFLGFWQEFNKFKNENNLSFDDTWKSRGIKRAKEIYVTSIAALASQQSEHLKRRWWITKPDQDPPDGVIGTIDETSLGNLINVREVEVVEHFDGDILDTITTKLKQKSYEPNTVLVCLISTTHAYNLKKISEDISKENLHLNHIFLAGHGHMVLDKNKITEQDVLEMAKKISLMQIRPVVGVSSLDPLMICKSWAIGKETNWLKLNKRGTKAGLVAVTAENPPKLF